jgi:hypothetical protein
MAWVRVRPFVEIATVLVVVEAMIAIRDNRFRPDYNEGLTVEKLLCKSGCKTTFHVAFAVNNSWSHWTKGRAKTANRWHRKVVSDAWSRETGKKCGYR